MTTKNELPPSWVYSMADYCQMFDLNDSDLDSAILDFPAGISSFNTEMHELGHSVLSGDPNYQMSMKEMEVFSQSIYDKNRKHLEQHVDILRERKVVDVIVEDWERRRRLFLNDYEKGKKEGRYQEMDLPRLPFDNQVFDIALCSDHLFHNHVTSQNQQIATIEELCRVAKEVRVFPLQDEAGTIATSLGQVMLDTQQKGCGIEIREVPYHEMKGGNAMLRIWATQCTLES